jgi:hypothetical protein
MFNEIEIAFLNRLATKRLQFGSILPILFFILVVNPKILIKFTHRKLPEKGA